MTDRPSVNEEDALIGSCPVCRREFAECVHRPSQIRRIVHSRAQRELRRAFDRRIGRTGPIWDLIS